LQNRNDKSFQIQLLRQLHRGKGICGKRIVSAV